jgi:hypothetical protein
MGELLAELAAPTRESQIVGDPLAGGSGTS